MSATATFLTRLGWAGILIVVIYVYQQSKKYLAFYLERQRTGCCKANSYPHTDPIFGYDLHKRRQQALRDGNTQAIYAADFDRLGKTWQENSLGQCVINTMDPLNHQYIHATGFANFGKSISRKPSSVLILGNGIFAAEGSHWKHSRSIIKPIFARAEVGNMEMMAKHVDRFLALLPPDSQTFDVQPMLKKLVRVRATCKECPSNLNISSLISPQISCLASLWTRRLQKALIPAKSS